jgi:hypothetical protein
LDRSRIKWLYEPRRFELGISTEYFGLVYIPDFYLPEKDIYIEVKGWASTNFKAKFKRMITAYPTVQVVLLDRAALFQLGVISGRGSTCNSNEIR